MNLSQTKKEIIDFEPGDHLWNEKRGECFKTTTSDGLVVVVVATGVRIAVPSTEMFYEVDNGRMQAVDGRDTTAEVIRSTPIWRKCRLCRTEWGKGDGYCPVCGKNECDWIGHPTIPDVDTACPTCSQLTDTDSGPCPDCANRIQQESL